MAEKQLIDHDTFQTIVDKTPLISIDLIVRDDSGRILLGQRLNRPAQNYWFVPGGRILKDESLACAFKRLTQNELGQTFNIDDGELLGPYDHFYDDYVFGTDVSTHYVAIAYVLKVSNALDALPVGEQHGGYRWFDIESIKNEEKVHLHSKWYFESEKLINARK